MFKLTIMRIAVILMLLLQSFAFSGPVCGNHATTAESMDCCVKGHNAGGDTAFRDPHSRTCCASCDMGKASAIKRQDNGPTHILPAQVLSILSIPVMLNAAMPLASFDSKHEYPPGPPDIFLIDRPLRI